MEFFPQVCCNLIRVAITIFWLLLQPVSIIIMLYVQGRREGGREGGRDSTVVIELFTH